MKRVIQYATLGFIFTFLMMGSAFSQDRDLPYFSPDDRTGLNQFEAPFTTDEEFEGIEVRVGGANTLQFQGLSHESDGADLSNLESNFNLATSNLDLDAVLGDGVRMHLRTYLSSQHHTETYVKGGYLQVDRLDFLAEGLLSGLMDHLRFKMGHMELNYGDNHFRRTDNGDAIKNPFVGNYLMDSFTTEVAGEVYYYNGPMFAMLGVSNGKLNQSVADYASTGIKTKPTFYGKLGYDQQVSEDLRIRLTGSLLSISQSPSIYLYAGDRAGSRYYHVMDDGFRAGRIAPGYSPGHGQPPAAGEMTAFMINPFIKYKGLEFYGVIERSNGKIETESNKRSFTQIGAELLYRFGFGAVDDFYLGGRYNTVSGELQGGNNIDVSRVNIGGGWYMNKNILAKLEYVSQTYDGYPTDSKYYGGQFNGVVLEAVVSF